MPITWVPLLYHWKPVMPMPCIYPTLELYGYHNCCYAQDNYKEDYQAGTGGFIHLPSKCPGHAPRVVTVPGGDTGAGDFSDTVKELPIQVTKLKEAL
ncbi:hypothetical protein HPB50_019959 [Hyalomma asiaticum]|uniref:Uncharacterized protein n=1 Tax=Hyalomma asiaticum TaxID=266040 RepID=A0ACB7T0U4_HYAAI|nr:hypothetical protein HPB50_019959 [Hyalomma asiaticum]